MKRLPRKTLSGERRTLALALTWDGARWPQHLLPAPARKFLSGKGAVQKPPAATETAKLFENDEVHEIRVCWVPRLVGGENVLAAPFPSTNDRRVSFNVVKSQPFGDILGVLYQRERS